MIKDESIWIGSNAQGEAITLLPKMANRHGFIAGATGTGKTVTLKVLAENFSALGVPVFMADVKGDCAGLSQAGSESPALQSRLQQLGIDDFSYQGVPVTFWDLYGRKGIQLRTTISEMGPLLLGQILGLSEVQASILSVIFKIADDNNLLLIDTKDLKALLTYVGEHTEVYEADYGKMSASSLGVIIRELVALEGIGGDIFFGEPALNISDWLSTDASGKGRIHLLDSSSFVNNNKLYAMFLLWLLSELFEALPEVGDLEKPKMIFFFDEAHLLFKDTPKTLLDKIEQVVKLIRSKGVGIYFCTQNPQDIPDGVLAQLGNKIEHALRAYTPAEQKAVKAAAMSFRENPDFDTFDTILNLGTGEAVVSFLDEKGVPTVAEKIMVLPPQCAFSGISDDRRTQMIQKSLFYSKYAQAVDADSAYEFLQRRGIEASDTSVDEKKQLSQKEKVAARAAEKREKVRKSEIKKVGNAALGSVGRSVGQSIGKQLFGSAGKTIGGNIGASLGRSILNTLMRR